MSHAPSPTLHVRRAAACAAAIGLACVAQLGCGTAGAGERLIEGIEPPSSVVLRWGAASCEMRSEAGLHSMHCATPGRGEPIFVTTATPYSPPIDLRDRFVKVWVRVSDVRRLAGMELRLSSDDFATSYFAFRIPLYRDPEFNVLQDETWTVLTLSFGSARVVGTPDRSRIDAIGWYVQDGGDGALDASWAGLAAVDVVGKGVVSFTFDDGTSDHLTTCAAELARAGYRGTAYVIPDMVGHEGFLSLDDLETLRDRYRWEIAAHHTTPLTELPPDRIEPAILAIQRYLAEHGFADGGAHFAFPLGKIRPGPVMEQARKHFATSRLAGSGPETIPPADPHKLRVFNVVRTTEPRAVAEAARLAVESGDWLILMLHRVRSPQQSDLDYAPEKLREIVDLLAAQGAPVRPLGEVWAEIPHRGEPWHAGPPRWLTPDRGSSHAAR